jgi:tetratricopeptide (TPR) repeat protein
MIGSPDLDMNFPPATDGEIAMINQASARQNAWGRFWRTPERPGLAEYIVEQEGLALEFLSDFGAFDRLGSLAAHLAHVEGMAQRTALIQAQIASMAHRFADARQSLAAARLLGAPAATVDRLLLAIDQACGVRLDKVLTARHQIAHETQKLEDQVPLGALLADLGEFDDADRVYRAALLEYQDVSPFAMAWVCFQLGVLWGELVPERQPVRAARWYRQAIAYLPSYVKGRVHLAEIYLDAGRPGDAEELLVPAIASGDPEVPWRLADVMTAMGRVTDAERQLQAARLGFEALLEKHLLAFADHAAEFYCGSGNDAARAFELARINVANRPTLRAFEQAHETAVDAGESAAASEILAAAGRHWETTAAFQRSSLVWHWPGGAGT